jgi:predicted MPP superfamily phosphohydrolase
MKLLAIGDLHGRSVWQTVNPDEWDKIVFVGDYADSPERNLDVVGNLEALIAFKKEFFEKVILLLGNHDLHYLFYPSYRCTGFKAKLQPALTKLYRDNQSLFLVAWQTQQHLFTHAGLSRMYFADLEKQLKNRFSVENGTLSDWIERIYSSEFSYLLFSAGHRRGGYSMMGGPLWADASETRHDHLEEYHQVVGHTSIPRIETSQRPGETGSSITYIATLDGRGDFFELIT